MKLQSDIWRVLVRSVIYPGILGWQLARYWRGRRRFALRGRAEWLQQTARAHRDWVNLRISVTGKLPEAGLIVANHVSYLDIVALSAVGGFTFVAKKEVAKWPIFGTCARLGGTVFIDRSRRGAVGDAAEELRHHVEGGVATVIFPEGTSSDGKRVLPFRSSLLEPAVAMGCPVTPCGIRYSLRTGRVEDEVAYWGDMTLAPHLLNLLRHREIGVELVFGEPRRGENDRKELARILRQDVCKLAGIDPGVGVGAVSTANASAAQVLQPVAA